MRMPKTLHMRIFVGSHECQDYLPSRCSDSPSPLHSCAFQSRSSLKEQVSGAVVAFPKARVISRGRLEGLSARGSSLSAFLHSFFSRYVVDRVQLVEETRRRGVSTES